MSSTARKSARCVPEARAGCVFRASFLMGSLPITCTPPCDLCEFSSLVSPLPLIQAAGLGLHVDARPSRSPRGLPYMA